MFLKEHFKAKLRDKNSIFICAEIQYVVKTVPDFFAFYEQ